MLDHRQPANIERNLLLTIRRTTRKVDGVVHRGYVFDMTDIGLSQGIETPFATSALWNTRHEAKQAASAFANRYAAGWPVRIVDKSPGLAHMASPSHRVSFDSRVDRHLLKERTWAKSARPFGTYKRPANLGMFFGHHPIERYSQIPQGHPFLRMFELAPQYDTRDTDTNWTMLDVRMIWRELDATWFALHGHDNETPESQAERHNTTKAGRQAWSPNMTGEEYHDIKRHADIGVWVNHVYYKLPFRPVLWFHLAGTYAFDPPFKGITRRIRPADLLGPAKE